jgi:hypothetical protein
MKNSNKARASGVQESLRKVATAFTPRVFPVWIDDEQAVSFSASLVQPRVRDSLILRLVTPTKSPSLRHASHAHGAR